MASPIPDASAPASVSVSKPQEPISDKDSVPAVNGHATSPLPSKDEDKSESNKPVVNGKPSAEPEAESPVNGVTTAEASEPVKTEEELAPVANKLEEPKPAETTDDKAPEDVTTEAKSPEKKSEDAPAEPKLEEVKAESEVPPADKPEEPKAAAEDVEMTDAAPKEPEPKPAEPVEDKLAESNDVDMTDKPEEPAVESRDAADEPKPTTEADLQPTGLSQLAIDSTEEASADVSMAEPTSAKIPRERDEDFGGEPAPKRARTEPKEDEVSAIVSAPAGVSGELSLSSVRRWNDVEVIQKRLTPHLRREIRRVIDRIKKTKAGGHFRDAVAKLWPGLKDAYLDKIEKPMDLGELSRNLKELNSPYTTVGDFRDDLALIFENTSTFNGPTHEVTQAALTATKNLWEEAITIPSEEPAKPKALPKAKPLREHRLSHVAEPVRRQSSGAAASPAVEVAEAKPKPSPLSADRTEDAARRASMGDADRPKRTVRAPKPKDIDYSTKASRKKLKPELQFAEEVLAEVMHPKHGSINAWFLDAVDAEGLNIPNYYSVIKKPMDFGKVSRMLAAGEFVNIKEFDKTARLIFANCYTFNGPPESNPVSGLAKELEDLYTAQMRGKDTWLAKHAKKAPPPSASNASDDDEDDDDVDDGGDSASAEAELVTKVRGLEKRLQDESSKLNGYFIADSPDQGAIDIQDVVVKAVRQAVLTAKQELAEFRQRPDKTVKKGAKPAKSKPLGSKAGGAAPTKKAAPPKKSGKKHLTAADKDAIANAINDLDYPHLGRAIDIIKSDTGQNENNDGELELDIDQLSDDALGKLWVLLRKVLPNFGRDSKGNQSPEARREPKPSKNAAPAKGKKNKPMTAQEQEARISQLRGLQKLYHGEADEETPVAQAPTPNDESSEDSDSEEE